MFTLVSPPIVTSRATLLGIPLALNPYVLLLADDARLRRELPAQLEHAGFGVYVAHGVGDAVDLARESQPWAIVLDLFHGTEDAWRQIKPAVSGSHLIITGRFTTAVVAERLRADAYVADAEVSSVMAAVPSFNN
jgi:ActR/RegA family two-component response regulator